MRWAVKKLGLTPCFDSAVLFPPLAANPEVACYGMIPSPTRQPAPIHPRLFAGGDSHRSQGFLYPWKPYAPPHIPVYCRFVPPPAAAEQTGKPVGTPAMLLPPAAAKASRECVGECDAAMGPGVKKPQATVLIAYGENAPGAVPEHATPGPFFLTCYIEHVQVWIKDTIQPDTQVARLEDLSDPRTGTNLAQPQIAATPTF